MRTLSILLAGVISGTASIAQGLDWPSTSALTALIDGDAHRLRKLIARIPKLVERRADGVDLLLWASDPRVSADCYLVLLAATRGETGNEPFNTRAQELTQNVLPRWPLPIPAVSRKKAESNQIAKLEGLRAIDGSQLLSVGRDPESPFAKAVRAQWFEVASYLFGLGVDPAAPENAHAVTRCPSVRAARYVLGKGFAPGVKDISGENALFQGDTVSRSEDETIAVWNYLISKGCPVNSPNKQGDQPLHRLVRVAGTYGAYYRVAEYLANVPEAISTKDSNGCTALFYAQYDFRTAEILVRAGADVNAMDGSGTPVLWSIVLGVPSGNSLGYTGGSRADWPVRRRIVELMVRRGANLNFRKKGVGKTLLDHVLEAKLPDEISDLRRLGAKMNWEIEVSNGAFLSFRMSLEAFAMPKLSSCAFRSRAVFFRNCLSRVDGWTSPPIRGCPTTQSRPKGWPPSQTLEHSLSVTWDCCRRRSQTALVSRIPAT